MRTAVEVLQQARDLLIRDGWIQGDFVNHDGRHCAMGAVHEIGMMQTVYIFLNDASRAVFPERVAEISVYAPIIAVNDHKATTASDVIAVFDKAIVMAKERAA